MRLSRVHAMRLSTREALFVIGNCRLRDVFFFSHDKTGSPPALFACKTSQVRVPVPLVSSPSGLDSAEFRFYRICAHETCLSLVLWIVCVCEECFGNPTSSCHREVLISFLTGLEPPDEMDHFGPSVRDSLLNGDTI
ncbi:unnamed protein product [Protopolystoma xenopodis]|uniref:Uncharacterized protein n=1 Tax=Protopolystoma xenopodis TaxID=117903 RepID=A0A3S5CI72_9PLAT|nr:unnamed protein product [Protopolystoma xenopodis]